MTRSERLLSVLQCLRRYRLPVSAAVLATEIGVSVRSIYRDIASLRAQGATIDGEAGIGFILKPGFLLPPLMFSQDEVEALVLGARWVAMRGDHDLSAAGRGALAKILAVLPLELRDEAELSALLAGPADPESSNEPAVRAIRDAIRREYPLTIDYADGASAATRRTIWPFALAYFDRSQVVAAWCELRSNYRHFRTDRLQIVDIGTRRYPRRRLQMIAEWRRLNGIPAQ